MEHVLDNPAWNALISGNKNLAYGTGEVKYFDKDVSPFTGFKQGAESGLRLLHEILPHSEPVIFISPVKTEIPGSWNLLRLITCKQMIFEGIIPVADNSITFVPLTEEHIPQMVALTQLTNPGPFAPRTFEFGHYKGIFEGDKLIAMAGQRMHVFDHAEISAVCTHPNHLGKGYARKLLLYHAARIREAGGVPFLHVRNDNYRAISVYESLGFITRKELFFHVVQKNN